MTAVQLGHGALILFACVGAAAGAVATQVPADAQACGAVAAACVAIVGVLGRYLPSASDGVNVAAVADAKAAAAKVVRS